MEVCRLGDLLERVAELSAAYTALVHEQPLEDGVVEGSACSVLGVGVEQSHVGGESDRVLKQ
ncbi:hypothetical protein K8Z61_17565 [Nocardioides sp. TRM66260-LWL]|uniref:hypothetical protein n=1 Tax=Nocardioides sp. TRM66260-LWL TaxID=2874478 RepID=UPI001CC3DF11|nr:hypothetical protein [Nocardioides sp. TRM66260-LWL]MBZ5736305.1 hypothetical protein [Nocardioides sp. TRM66260-LWL]